MVGKFAGKPRRRSKANLEMEMCFSFGQCASDPGSRLVTFSVFKVMSFQLLNVKS